MPEQIPSMGRIVHYQLSAADAQQINRRRTTGKSIADRMRSSTAVAGGPTDPAIYAWPAGAQAHIGNVVVEGDIFPMLIVRVWGPTASSAVNGQVFLDGCDVFWATSRVAGDQPGTWAWPALTR